ncbi:MAG: hypothetical protein WC670_08395 [Pseudolabrys sp.]|jgi:hypothetical protein
MRRIALTILGLCLLLTLSLVTSNNATAGDYYYGRSGYRGENVRYSSNCCYRKIVKVVRKVRYVRVDDGYRHGYEAPRYRSSYYSDPYRSTYYSEPYRGTYYNEPYRTTSYSAPYRGPTYYGRPYRYDGGEYYGGTGGYRVGYSAGYGDGCTVRRVRVADGRGGWVWARSRVCY